MLKPCDYWVVLCVDDVQASHSDMRRRRRREGHIVEEPLTPKSTVSSLTVTDDVTDDIMRTATIRAIGKFIISHVIIVQLMYNFW